MKRNRRFATGAFVCAGLALGLVLIARFFFPGVLAIGPGESFAAGYFAVVLLIPLIVMFTLASLVLAAIAALAREKILTLLTLALIAATWTYFSPYTVQELVGEIAAEPFRQMTILLLLAVSALIYLTPVLFLLVVPARRRN